MIRVDILLGLQSLIISEPGGLSILLVLVKREKLNPRKSWGIY